MDPARLLDKIRDTLDSFGLLPASMWETVLQEINSSSSSPTACLLEKGYILDPMTGVKLADQWNVLYSDLSTEEVDRSVRARLPMEIIRGWNILPVRIADGKMVLAVSDPLVVMGKDRLERELGMPVDFLFVSQERLSQILDEIFPSTPAGPDGERSEEVQTESVGSEIGASIDAGVQAETGEAPIIALIEQMIMSAYQSRASDIHIEPFAEWTRIRYRIDGMLKEVDRLAKDIHASVVTRIKILANMDIAEKRFPQDGRILFEKSGVYLDLRVSTMNTNYGETVVIRLLDKERGLISLEDLGMDQDMLGKFRRLIGLPYGMVLVTGPTGSGKSTTLYAALQEVDRTMRKVITVEDPVEYQMPGINQVQVRPVVGLTFASALRAILRQAPDIIMVGEIRDKETAQIAVQAALTGHLVLSTLHTNDAPSAVTRLVDMGVPPYLVASCIAGVLAQRLVRRLCPHCKQEVGVTPEEQSFLRHERVEKVCQPVGCPECGMSGYKGRIGIFELMVVDSELRDAIARGEPVGELRFIAEKRGMRPLRDDGLEKVKKGITTVAEIMRVIG